ncbi:MAG: glycerol-3-phosphate 1-O-acyltransferase PlsY [Victivallaceae bacterium]|nr:glycerol-3-phosphate 1-O-acyltransferase PlsY [Victivallaceae bacterium]
MEIAIFILLSYLLGSIPCGFLIGKCYGKDLRKLGSCNVGATNVTRVIGRWQGKLCFALDFVKGALPVAAANLFFSDRPYLVFVGAIMPVIGHIFSIFLKFKGGKGVSTAAGAIFAINPAATGTALVLWVVVFLLTRYVSVASICAALSVAPAAWLFRAWGVRQSSNAELIFFAALAGLVIALHHANIKRLFSGTENRFSKSSAKE